VVLGLVSWLTEPLAKLYFDWRNKGDEKYEDTWLSRVASLMSQLAKVTGIVYASDMISVVLTSLGFQLDPRIQPMLAKAAYALWGAWRLRTFKEFTLKRMIRREKGDLGKAKVLGRILDAVIAIWLLFFMQDIFQISTGRGIASVLTAGGTAGLLFSWASKDLAAGLVSGLAIHTSHHFAKGDEIILGDGTRGIVEKIGAMETLVKGKYDLGGTDKCLGTTYNIFHRFFTRVGQDGIVVRIPNAQIATQRVQNLSQTATSEVKQTLWFKYDDIDTIPMVVEEIKKEIRASCPKLITDGSRPFRVYWSEFKDDHLEVMVNINFSISPAFGLECMENRQVVMQAIGRAVKNSGVEFAMPNYICKNEDIGQKEKNSNSDLRASS
jgi:small-conductance mechanosensitive channel